MRRAFALSAIIVAALWLTGSPASAQGATRVIETVPADGASQVARIPDMAAPRAERADGPPRRVALVIGNSAYHSAVALPNPANDSKAVAQLLASAGFEVISAVDLTHDEMRRVIADFTAKIAERGPNTVALVFYAGHGVQVDGENFLVPVDARLERVEDVADQTVRLFDLMKALESVPSRMRIVILDACRNNPFAALGDAAGKGFAIVDAPTGSIVAYSTAPGTEAFDGGGRHSPYAAAFLRISKTPGLPIEQMFKRMRLLVHEATDGRQTPWESSSLTGDFTFFPFGGAEVANAAPRPKTSRLAEVRTRSVREAYEIVIEEDAVEYYEEFVLLYPSHPLCDRIRWLLLRRLQMIAWYNAVLANSQASYKTYLAHFPNSDHAGAARRLQERPRVVPLPQPPKGPVVTKPVSPNGEGKLPNGPIVTKPLPIPPIGDVKPLPTLPAGPVVTKPVPPIGEVKPKPLPLPPAGPVVTKPLPIPPTGSVQTKPIGPIITKPLPLPAKDPVVSKPTDRIVTLPARPVDNVINRPLPSDRVITRPALPDVTAPKKLSPPIANRQFDRPLAIPASPSAQRPQLGPREAAGCRIINGQRVCGRS